MQTSCEHTMYDCPAVLSPVVVCSKLVIFKEMWNNSAIKGHEFFTHQGFVEGELNM